MRRGSSTWSRERLVSQTAGIPWWSRAAVNSSRPGMLLPRMGMRESTAMKRILEVWRKLGGLDPEFHPIWFEDVDFCKRARDAGFVARYVPEVVATHRGGHSINILNWRCREVYWYASLLRYASKHFRRRAFRGVSAAVILSSVPRAIYGFFRWRSLQAFTVYGRVIRLAAQSMVSGRVQQPDVCPVLSKAVG